MSSVLFLENAIYYEHNELLRLIWMTFWYTVRCCFQGSALPPSLPKFPFAIVMGIPWWLGCWTTQNPQNPQSLSWGCSSYQIPTVMKSWHHGRNGASGKMRRFWKIHRATGEMKPVTPMMNHMSCERRSYQGDPWPTNLTTDINRHQPTRQEISMTGATYPVLSGYILRAKCRQSPTSLIALWFRSPKWTHWR